MKLAKRVPLERLRDISKWRREYERRIVDQPPAEDAEDGKAKPSHE
jgi:hypothetical protein